MTEIDKNRELFSIELLTERGQAIPAKMLSRVIQEFLALTLLPNRDLAEVLKVYGKVLGLSEQLPKPIYDQWVSRHAKAGQAFAEIAATAERKRLRKQVLTLRGTAYQEIEKQLGLIPRNVEHIAFRAVPIQIIKPQSRGHGRMQLLLAAYHLEQCWLHVMHTDACSRYSAQGGMGHVSLAAMQTTKQWTDFAEKLRSRPQAAGGNADAPIILHTPKGSGLGTVLSEAGRFFVAEDLPALRADHALLSIRFKIKHSVERPLEQVSFANLRRPPSVEDPLLNGDMTALPDLAKLDHKQKDQLIATLWAALTSLRQIASPSPSAESTGDSADKAE